MNNIKKQIFYCLFQIFRSRAMSKAVKIKIYIYIYIYIYIHTHTHKYVCIRGVVNKFPD